MQTVKVVTWCACHMTMVACSIARATQTREGNSEIANLHMIDHSIQGTAVSQLITVQSKRSILLM